MRDVTNSRTINQVQSYNNSCYGITHVVLVSTCIKILWSDLIKPTILLYRFSVYKICVLKHHIYVV
jgi:hypothetical protein